MLTGNTELWEICASLCCLDAQSLRPQSACPSWVEGPSQAQCVAEDPGSSSQACQLPSGASFCLLCPCPPSRHTYRYGPGLGSLPELFSHLESHPNSACQPDPSTPSAVLNLSTLWGVRSSTGAAAVCRVLAPARCPISWLLLWGPP